MATQRVTSGLFPVPSDTGKACYIVYLLLTNASDEEVEIPFQVNRLAEDGVKVLFRSGLVHIPKRGTGRIIIEDAADETIEVMVELPSSLVKPSISIVETTKSNNIANTVQWVSPFDFTVLPSAGSTEEDAPSPTVLSSGFFPIDIDQSDTTIPATYELVLYMSNYSDVNTDVSYVLQWARPVFLAKTQLQQGEEHIPVGSGTSLAFQDVAGKTTEITVQLHDEAVVPSCAVLRYISEREQKQLVTWISAKQLARLSTSGF